MGALRKLKKIGMCVCLCASLTAGGCLYVCERICVCALVHQVGSRPGQPVTPLAQECFRKDGLVRAWVQVDLGFRASRLVLSSS